MKVSDIEVTYIDHMGSDLSVVNAARVSFHKVSSELKDGDTKLINYLAKHKHFSPFNHAFISFRIKAPIFVARQLVKHKFMPWNEVSRRYVDGEPEFYFPDYYRARATNVKQGSSDEPVEDVTAAAAASTFNSLKAYNLLLERGVAPEQARMVLPQNMMTEWIWSGTLGAYADMLKLRLDPHTQYESRIVANRIYEKLYPHFPISITALLDGYLSSPEPI
jgi:thymidylate synthase (FAD)